MTSLFTIVTILRMHRLPYFSAAPIAVSTLIASCLILSGCGGNMANPAPGNTSPTPNAQPTTIALQMSVTANDRFEQYGMQLDSVTLATASGTSATLISQPVSIYFMQTAGGSAPLATVQIPQGTYTSATLAAHYIAFDYIYLENNESINFATDEYGYLPTPAVVQLSSPIVVGSSPVGLNLTLEATASGTFTTSFPETYTITPTFTLQPFSLTAAATPASPALSPNLHAQLVALNSTAGTASLQLTTAGTNFTMDEPNGPAIPIQASSTTVFQGAVTSLATLSIGDFLSVDLLRQPDGSLLATRVAVEDPAAKDIAVGELAGIAPNDPVFNAIATEKLGSDLATAPLPGDGPYHLQPNATFQVSPQWPTLLQSLPSLPFAPTFTQATWASGQRVALGLADTTEMSGTGPTVSSVTLEPQTIDATILTATPSASGLATYTAQLGSLDPIVQVNLPTPDYPLFHHLATPQIVTIYSENSVPFQPNLSFHFTGYLFNDAGNWRMICTDITPGETP